MSSIRLILWIPLLLLLLVAQEGFSQCGANIDLGTWIKEGESAHGNWVVTNGGNDVDQDINGDPTFYVSPDSFANVVIRGNIRVTSAGASFVDNDWVGFVFGYSGPDTLDSNNYNFYLFDWKKADQTFGGFLGKEGFAVSRVDGPVTNFPEAFSGKDGPYVTPIDSLYGNNLGWDFDQTYSFALTYTNTRVYIAIEGDTIFNITGCFEPGRFGFYNYSQELVTYSDFNYNVAAAFTILTPDVCANDIATAIAVSDSCDNAAGQQVNNTITGWEWDMGDGTTVNDTNAQHVYTAPGVYQVRLVVTDYLGCTDTAYNSLNVQEVDVDLGLDTSICPVDSVTLDAGATPVGYSWSSGQTSQTVTVNAQGTYTVTVSDALGCTSIDTLDLGHYALPPIDITTPDSTVCIGDTTELQASGAATYVWNNIAGLTAYTGDTVNALPTISTTYQVVGTDSIGCVDSTTLTVIIQQLPTLSISAAEDTICEEDTTNIVVSGAATYSWASDTSLVFIGQDSVTVRPLATKTFSVTATDTNGCIDTISQTITVNPLPSVSINAFDTTLCLNDQTILAASGALSYVWSPNYEISTQFASAIVVDPKVDTTYFVEGTDVNGCRASDSVSMEVFALPAVVLTASDTEICIGDTIGISASGAVSFAWVPANGLQALTGDSVVAIPTASVTYQVVGTNAEGCTDTGTISIIVNSLPVLSISPVADTICQEDSVIIDVDGANMYFWTNTGSLAFYAGDSVKAEPQVTTVYQVTATDTNGCVDTISSTITVDTLPLVSIQTLDSILCLSDSAALNANGANVYAWSPSFAISSTIGGTVMVGPQVDTTYVVTGTNANGCSSTDSVFIEVDTLPIINVTASQSILCFTDSAGLLADGASTYAWINAIGLQSLTGDSVVAIPASTITYEVVGTDTNGCSDTGSAAITVNPLPVLSLSVEDNTLCLEDSSFITVDGAPSYVWSNTGSLLFHVPDSATAGPLTTTIYSITGTDANGCSDSIATTITVDTLPLVSVSPAAPEICIGNQVTLTASGAQDYAWSPAIDISATVGTQISASPSDTTTYMVVGTDANGCQDDSVVTVIVNPLPVLSISSIDTNICIGDTIGIKVEGAATYFWTNNTGTGPFTTDSITISPTDSTFFTIIGSDTNGCPSIITSIIDLDSLPEVSLLVSDDTLCLGESSLFQAANAASYAWQASVALSSTIGSTNTATPTATETFTVTGTDANLCSQTVDTTIIVNGLPTASVSPGTHSMCEGDSVQLTASGATSYAWSPSNGLSDSTAAIVIVFANDTNTYTVTATDANGCTDDTTVTINITPLPELAINFSSPIVCTGTADTLFASGALAYEWREDGTIIEPTADQVVVFPAQTQTYEVTGTGIAGCETTVSVIIEVYEIPPYSAGPDQEKCSYEAVQLEATGVLNGLYKWKTQDALTDSTIANPISTADTTTTYTVEFTDTNGCVFEDSMTLTVHPRPVTDAGGAVEVCRFDSVQIGGAPTGPAGALFNWAPIASADSNPVVYTDSTSKYFVTVTSTEGCVNFDSVVVEINELPEIDFIKSPAFICLNAIDTVQVTPGHVDYDWSSTLEATDLRDGRLVLTPTESRTYYLTVTDTNGCVDSSSWLLLIKRLPTVEAGPAKRLCMFDSVRLEADSNDLLLSWSGASTLSNRNAASPWAFPDQSGYYHLTGIDSNGCRENDSVSVTVFELPFVNAGNDILNCEMDRITLGGVPAGPDTVSYSWSPTNGLSDSTIAKPLALPTERTTYTLTVRTNFGCENQDSVRIITDCWSVYAPTAFSPDGNFINDVFFVKHYRVFNPHLRVWDRFGHLVFETKNLDEGWDGRLNGRDDAPIGVYFWSLLFEDEFGRNISKEGNLTLVR